MRWEDAPDYPCGLSVTLRVLIRKKVEGSRVREGMTTETEGRVREIFEDAMLSALKMERGATSPGMQVASDS